MTELDKHPITIFIGLCFSLDFGWYDENEVVHDFTGYGARMDIRTKDGTLITSLTTANGRIILGSTDPNIKLRIDDADTALLQPQTRADWDLILDAPSGCAIKFPLDGPVTIRRPKTQ